MNWSSLLDKITTKQQERAKAKFSDYRALVRQIGDGNEPAVEDVERILLANNRTVEQLRQDVEVLNRRREMRQKYDLEQTHKLSRRR